MWNVIGIPMLHIGKLRLERSGKWPKVTLIIRELGLDPTESGFRVHDVAGTLLPP